MDSSADFDHYAWPGEWLLVKASPGKHGKRAQGYALRGLAVE